VNITAIRRSTSDFDINFRSRTSSRTRKTAGARVVSDIGHPLFVAFATDFAHRDLTGQLSLTCWRTARAITAGSTSKVLFGRTRICPTIATLAPQTAFVSRPSSRSLAITHGIASRRRRPLIPGAGRRARQSESVFNTVARVLVFTNDLDRSQLPDGSRAAVRYSTCRVRRPSPFAHHVDPVASDDACSIDLRRRRQKCNQPNSAKKKLGGHFRRPLGRDQRCLDFANVCRDRDFDRIDRGDQGRVDSRRVVF